MIVKTDIIDGKKIEIYEDGFSRKRFWAKVDGRGLFQRGRMRLRAFATVEAAHEAAIEEARQ